MVSVKVFMSLVTIVLRVIIGVVLAGGLMVWGGLSFPIDSIIVLSVGIMAAIWGDKFILGFMSLMRYFRW